MNPRTLLPGQQYTATEMNELARQVAQSARKTGSGSLAAVDTGLGTIFRDLSEESILARITGSPTGARYPYVEVVRNSDGTTTDIAAADGGRHGTATDTPAVELAGRTDVPTNSIVQLSPLPGGGGWGFGWGQTSTLTTGNVGDSGAQDSTTTLLRFDDSTRIKVTKGATSSDPDIVSMTGLSATTSGLTIPGTTVAGVVTATRDLPALPRAWVRFNTVGGTLTVGPGGGELGTPTVARVAKGWFRVTWTGASVNAAVSVTAIGETTNAVEVGAVMSALGVVDVFVTSGGAADDVIDCSVIIIY